MASADGVVMADTHRGPWEDSARAAMNAALAEVGVMPGEFLEVQYGEGVKFEPVDPEGRSISCEVEWSESRQQYKAILRRNP
jgi:hypothetical protein